LKFIFKFQSNISSLRNLRLFGRLVTHIRVPHLPPNELVSVLQTRHPSLFSLALPLVECFFAIQAPSSPPLSSDSPAAPLSRCRPLSSRDLIKWCRRIELLGYANGQIERVADWMGDANGPQHHAYKERFSRLLSLLPVRFREMIFLEGVDCLCASIPSSHRAEVIHRLGRFWNISDERIQYYSFSYKPITHTGESAISIGRVSLPILNITTDTIQKVFHSN
jgi:hypothetical protein